MNQTGAATLVALVPDELSPAQRVRLSAYGLVAAHACLVGWALLRAWFYADDFTFLREALEHGPTPGFLFTPHDSQLMPVGRAMTWVVAQGGPFNWALAAGLMLVLHVVAALACVVMLRTLFGDRWGILVPLGLYVFSPMGLEATMWWSAALNAVPIQIAFFLLVTCLVRWARERRGRWALASAAALALGVLSGPRGLVMVVPTGLLLMVFFTSGPWWARPWAVVRQHLLITGPLAVLGVAYVAAYAASTPSPVADGDPAPVLGLARTFFGTSWLTSAVGGPWRWDQDNPPLSRPDPPTVLHVVATVVVVVLVLVAVHRRRTPALGALGILVAQLVVTYLALVLGRGVQLGAAAGLSSRYLADSLPVTALAVGLAMLPVEGSTARAVDRRPGSRARAIGAVGALAFVVGSLTTTVAYANAWHRNDPARQFVAAARTSLAADPAVIADVGVPDDVRSALSSPDNLPSRLFAPVDSVRTARRGNDLRMLDTSGRQRSAAVIPSTRARSGPVANCGYLVADRAVRIHVDRDRVIPFWWLSIGYLASADGTVDVRVEGKTLRPLDVQAGLHTYFLSGEGPFSTVELRSVTDGLTLCVNPVQTGNLVPLP